jgi:hypothetical protein
MDHGIDAIQMTTPLRLRIDRADMRNIGSMKNQWRADCAANKCPFSY